jgi:glycosidase
MYLVMDLPLTTTSIKHQWFDSAKRGNRTYRDYYIWSTTQRNGSRFWTKADNARNEYYLHYENNPNLPILNWSNEKVRQQMAVSSII